MSRAWPSIRKNLFVKIYLTLLASLAAVAIASGIFVRLGQDEQETGWQARRDRVVAAMIPAGADPTSVKTTLDRLSEALDADLAVYDADGGLIASAGGPLPQDILSRKWRQHDDFHTMVMRLPDGRTVAARMEMPFGPGGRNPLAYLAMIAGVIGLDVMTVV